MYNLAELKNKLVELGVRPKKSLGQNFLIFEGTINKIVAAALETKGDSEALVEIGPGLGALTEKFINLGHDIHLVELDSKFSQFWQDKGISVINQDALKLNWSEAFSNNFILVSNLPYQISSSLVIDMSTSNYHVVKMVLMFQKEVAQRILSKNKSKSYGLLSVIAQTFWNVDLLLEAGPKDFYPPPSIASQVLVFKDKRESVEHPEDYLRFIKAAFHQRRKKLINNLKQYSSSFDWKALWQDLEIKEGARAEEISVNQYIDIYKKIKSY